MLGITKADLELQQKLTFQVDAWIEEYFKLIDQRVYGISIKYDAFDNPFRITGRHVQIESDGHTVSFPVHYLQMQPHEAVSSALEEYLAKKAKKAEEAKIREMLLINEQIIARQRELDELKVRMEKLKV